MLQYGDEEQGRRKYLLNFNFSGSSGSAYEGRDEIERRVQIKG